MACIYMYENKINGKKYIGQTNNIKRRHSQHLCTNETCIDKAIKTYGAANFRLVILEDGIESQEELDERERFYIEYYDTYNSGYNKSYGGQKNGYTFSKRVRDRIIELLRTDMPMAAIATKVGCSIFTISDINNGYICPKDGVIYPIRARRCSDKFTVSDCIRVIDYLKSTSFSASEIAKLTNTNTYYVNDVNRGRRLIPHKEDVVFPIRKSSVFTPNVTLDLALRIVDELKNSDSNASQIGEKFGIPAYTVGSINRGKHSICKQISEVYPIRKTPHRNKLAAMESSSTIPLATVIQIIELLINSSLSTEEISQRFNVSKNIVNRINQGKTFKPITLQFKVPIRQNSQANIPILDSIEGIV